MLRIQRGLIALSLPIALIACVRTDCYSVKMRYVGRGVIHDARVSYGSFTFNAGVLIPNGAHEYLEVCEPVPQIAIVEWTDASGNRERSGVRVVTGKRFHGVLVIEVGDRNMARAIVEQPPSTMPPR